MTTKSQKNLLVLITSSSFDRQQLQNCQRAMTLLKAKGISFDVIDGANLANRESRNELFKISGLRAKYPQFFLINDDKSVEFLGDWDKIEAVNDASGLPDDVLDANPSIITWDKVLGSVPASHAGMRLSL